jgi:hypothetical protein
MGLGCPTVAAAEEEVLVVVGRLALRDHSSLGKMQMVLHAWIARRLRTTRRLRLASFRGQ